MYSLQFTEQELAFILNVLGDLPTKSNAYIVVNTINAQLEKLKQPEQEQAEA